MKKILFVTNTMGRAGAETTMLTMMEEFDKTQYDISLFSIIPRGECFKDVPPEVTILNKRYTSKSVLSFWGTIFLVFDVLYALMISAIKNFSKTRKYIGTYIKKRKFGVRQLAWLPFALAAPAPTEEFDLAIAFLEGASAYYVIDRINAKEKIAYVHLNLAMKGHLKEIDEPYYSKMDRIYGVSDKVVESLIADYPQMRDKIDVFQNMIKDKLIRKRAQHGAGFTDNFDGIRLLSVARLHPQKAYDVAIEAMDKLLKMGDFNIRWYAMGEGTERNKLQKLINEKDLSEKFILMGQRSNPYPYIKQCDIYMHCTGAEGWSIAIAEARILGKPMIASKESNAGKQLPPGCVMVVPLDAEEIAKGIYRMITNDDLRREMTMQAQKPWRRPDDIGKLYDLLEKTN